MQVTQKTHRDGSKSVRVGRTWTRLRTTGEVDAFLAGVAIAKLALANAIAPLIEVKDGDALRATAAALNSRKDVK